MPNEITEKIWPKGKKIKQLFVRYMDVGQLSPDKADEFVAKINNRPGWKSIIDQLQEQGIAVANVPVRPGSETRLEIIPLEYELDDDGDFEIMINPSEECEQEEGVDWMESPNAVPGIDAEMEGEG